MPSVYRSARYGKGRLYYKRLLILHVHRIYTWLLDSRKAWAANIAIKWLPCRSSQRDKLDYINIESENQKSGLIILLVLFHSACPYKNYCLKCFTELQTLFIYLFKFFFFYLVCNLVELEYNIIGYDDRSSYSYYG